MHISVIINKQACSCYCVGLMMINITINSILNNDQLDTYLLYFTIRLLHSSTCFEHYISIIRRMNCIDAASGIVTLKKVSGLGLLEYNLLHCL
jgi:hypothetical protein